MITMISKVPRAVRDSPTELIQTTMDEVNIEEAENIPTMNRTESINTLEDVDGKLFRDWQDYNKRSKKKGVWPFGSKVPDTEETKVPISVGRLQPQYCV